MITGSPTTVLSPLVDIGRLLISTTPSPLGQLEEDRAQYLVGYMANAMAVNLTDKSMFQGLAPWLSY